jgi:C-terminal processing protease CtpA/Prc
LWQIHKTLFFLPPFISIRYTEPTICWTLAGSACMYSLSLLVDRHTASAAEMIVAFARENNLASIVGEPTACRLLSATSVKVGQGFRLALPTGAYYTWKGTALEGTPFESDERIGFDWQQRRAGIDGQLEHAIDSLCIEGAGRAR